MSEFIKRIGKVLGLSFESIFLGLVISCFCYGGIALLDNWIGFNANLKGEYLYITSPVIGLLYMSNRLLSFKEKGFDTD